MTTAEIKKRRECAAFVDPPEAVLELLDEVERLKKLIRDVYLSTSVRTTDAGCAWAVSAKLRPEIEQEEKHD